MTMKTKGMMLVAALATACCMGMMAQGVQNIGDGKIMVKIDHRVPVTNVNLRQGPKLLTDNRVEFTVRAPEAQKV